MEVACICKLMPYYRLGVFNELSKYTDPEYCFLGDTKEQGGIYTIPAEYASKKIKDGGIRWVFTKSIFYKPNRQLWQKGVLNRIFFGHDDLFIMEGAIAHFSIWIFALACKIAKKKVLFWSHGLKGTDKGLNLIIRRFFFKYMADGLLLYGNFSRNLMIEQGFDAEKIFTIGNSLNYPEQKKLRELLLGDKSGLQRFREELPLDLTHKTILFIGRLEENKRIDEILTAMHDLDKGDGVKLNCIIIGDGSEMAKLKMQCEELNLTGSVFFVGRVYDDSIIAKYFLISDLMVSPGNVGLNCIHAMAFGLPVLTHDNFKFQNPEVEAIQPGENGLLFDYYTKGDLKNKIKDWFYEDRTQAYNSCIKIIEERFNPKVHADLINKGVISAIGRNNE